MKNQIIWKLIITKTNEENKDETDDELATKLHTMTAVPKTKYPVPMTANQEIGWDLEEIQTKNNWNKPKKSCNETKYAADYVTMTQVSPFANKGLGK